MHEANFEETLDAILAKDLRYRRDAYLFVRDALDFTQKAAARERREGLHVTGQELLAGVRDYALAQFGPMAITVLEDWGITKCEDFGEIVFNVVEAGLFSKTDKDSRDDFQGGYDFEEAFRKPFLPQSKTAKEPKPVAKME
ncbi:MAG TPA: Minf_1886 family protein [Verrucomicrobiae bacterium]|nr:Minf_1886 family protein [Verrucomicrobiae bacterium]